MKKQLLLLVMMLLPIVASAQRVEIDGIRYYLTSDTKTATVVNNTPKYSGEINIPASVSYNDEVYSVTSISSSAFARCTDLISVFIPNSVTTIYDSAFSGCINLKTINISNSVTEIQNWCFMNCKSLTSINFPSSITTISMLAFSNCESLKELFVPNSVTFIANSAFSGCSGISSIVVEEGNTVYNSLGNCNAIIETATNTLHIGCANTIIPNSVTSIGDYAFEGHSTIKTITIPYNIVSIGNYAFNGCRLESVVAKNPLTLTAVSYPSFSDASFKHAILYIPMGTRWSAIYDGGWGAFVNIREMAAETNELAYDKAFTLMNAKSFGYVVYDPVNNDVRTIDSFSNVDENVANNSWQVIDTKGGKYLYNIGAKQYASIDAEGKIVLSKQPKLISMDNGQDGIVMGGSDTQWNFVLNEKMGIDESVTAITATHNDNGDYQNHYFDLNGRKLTGAPTQKGIYINNGKKVVVK